jgi:hypothetical protein
MDGAARVDDLTDDRFASRSGVHATLSSRIGPGGSEDEALQRIYASRYNEKTNGLESLIAKKVDDLRHYDVPGMQKAVGICTWGRSGSLLLASYLDGHDHVVMLPQLWSMQVYVFFEQYAFLSLREKLVAYPDFVAEKRNGEFFSGQFPIAEPEYYAAIGALLEVYGDQPPQFLTSRRTFFQFMHVAYSLALGRHPAIPRPVMVYASHSVDDAAARRLMEDFPEVWFLHAIRDPITCVDSGFDWRLRSDVGDSTAPLLGYIHCALSNVSGLIQSDQPHQGMEARTRAIRFEDMHLKTAETMRCVADWLGLPFQPSMLESTFNGLPYVVASGGKTWSGSRPEQAQRHWRNMFFTDRALLFALLHENFSAWNYPSPRAFAHVPLRILAWAAVALIPMKMEIITARVVLQRQVFPAVRCGKLGFAIRALLRLVACRWFMMRAIAVELRRRLAGKKTILQALLPMPPAHDP